MNSRKAALVISVLCVVCLLAVSSISATRRLPIMEDLRLQALGTVSDFHFSDAIGTPISLQTLEGTIWVADFFFTSCSGPCPVMATKMADLARTFSEDDRVHFVSFTVNPEVDTGPVLRQYAARYDADPERWHFVRGESEAIQRLAIEGFKIGSMDEPLMHSARFVLVDGKGTIRGYYMATDTESALELTQDIKSLLMESRN